MSDDAQYGLTVLHRAVMLNSADMVRDSLKAGADVDARDVYGRTPLHYAAKLGCTEALKALVAGGADVNAQDEDGRTALMFAAGAPWPPGEPTDAKPS